MQPVGPPFMDVESCLSSRHLSTNESLTNAGRVKHQCRGERLCRVGKSLKLLFHSYIRASAIFVFMNKCNTMNKWLWMKSCLKACAIRWTKGMIPGFLLTDLRDSCSIHSRCYTPPCPLQSHPHSLGSGDPPLRSFHLRPEHHHRHHAGPGKDLTAPPPSLIHGFFMHRLVTTS